MTINDDLARIERWLRHHAPATFADLGPPADPAQITELEAILGFELNPDVTVLLRWHDGSGGHDRGFPLSPGFPLNGTAQIARTWQLLSTRATRVRREEGMEDWWEPSWLPLASDHTGSELIVDHSTQSAEQVFHFDPTEGRSRLRPSWPNLGVAVSQIATALSAGSRMLGLTPVIDEDGYLDWSDVAGPRSAGSPTPTPPGS